MTISPNYTARGKHNPYYIISNTIVNKINVKTPRFRNVDKKTKVKDFIYKNGGSFIFEIYSGDTPTGTYIRVRKTDIKNHEGGSSRKDSTASSNINEVFSLYFLKYPYKSYDATVDFIHKQRPTTNTGIIKGNSTDVTFGELQLLLDKDDTAELDMLIGYNNSIALKKDGVTNPTKLYWTPREKPNGVNSKHPADIVIETKSGHIGYSNKAIANDKDDTPKFNTNLHAFFKNDNKMSKTIKNLIDTAWMETVDESPDDIKAILSSVDITKEPYTETGSKILFSDIGKAFLEAGYDFFKSDFYYKYRNNSIEKFITLLKKQENAKLFLNTIYTYMYGNSESLPYKLLIGSKTGSKIKEVSDNTQLKNILKPNKVTNIKGKHNGSQGFDVYMTVDGKDIIIPITMRTRSAGGWSGKSLFITTPGLILV